MKTAISIPPQTFAAAERFARRKGFSRSELYTRAVEEFIRRHGDETLTKQINAALGGHNTKLEPDVKAAAHKLLAAEEW